MLNKKLLLTAAIALSTIISSHVLAETQDVGASLNSQQAISISNVRDMDFGLVTYATNHSGNLSLETDGSIVLAGNNTGLSLSGSTHTGSFDISSGGGAMEITCSKTATLATPAGDTLLLNPVLVKGHPNCRGVGVDPIVADNVTSVELAGLIAISSNSLTTGTYSTANAGGSPVTVSIVYQ